MKILLTGATGFVGTELGKALVKEGYEIFVLTRNKENAKLKIAYPATLIEWDATKGEPNLLGFDEIEAVVHLAGEPIAEGRWTEEKKKALKESRIQGTENLIKGLKNAGIRPRVFVAASAIGYYGDRGDEIITEETPPANDFLGQLCQDWEASSAQILNVVENCRLCIFRINIVLGRDGGFLKQIVPIFKKGVGGPLGSGKQWMSWVHRQDLVRLILEALKNEELSGTFNAGSGHPITNLEMTKTLGSVLGVPTFFPVPKLGLRVVYGELADALLSSQRVISSRLPKIGFVFKFTELEEALKDSVEEARNGELMRTSEQWVPKKIDDIFPFFEDERNLKKITPETVNFEVLSELEPLGGGTLLKAHVKYTLPFGRIGQLLPTTWIQRDIQQVFLHRKKAVMQLFGSVES